MVPRRENTPSSCDMLQTSRLYKKINQNTEFTVCHAGAIKPGLKKATIKKATTYKGSIKHGQQLALRVLSANPLGTREGITVKQRVFPGSKEWPFLRRITEG